MNGKKEGDIQSENTQNSILGSVLVVEDDIFIADLLEKKLLSFQLKIFRAMDVDSARLILESDKLDLILLDIMLPGVDGIAFLKEIKNSDKFRSIPVILLSNLGQKEEIERGIKAGAELYLVKANMTIGEITGIVLETIDKNKKHN